MKGRAKAGVKFAARLSISLALLGWLLQRSDLQKVAQGFGRIPATAWLTAFGMYIASQLVSTTRWRILARALGFPGSWIRYLQYYFVGMYFNLFLPTGVGGDLFKAMFLMRQGGGRLAATWSVIMDRATGLVAMFILGGASVVLVPGLLPAHFTVVLKGVLSGLVVGLPLFCLFSQGAHRIWPWAQERLETLLVLGRRPRVCLAALALSLVVQGLCMGIIAMLARSMGLPPHPLFYFAAYPLVALMILLPVSFNGIGVREGGFIYFLGLKGVEPERALCLSLSFFAIQVAAGLVGGLFYTLGWHRKVLTE